MGYPFQLQLQFWDTAGQERFRKSMIQHYYRNVNAVIFVYDVTNPTSFDSLPTWLQECEKYSLTTSVPRILVGNKVDCGQQLVATNRAQMFADMHCMPVSWRIIQCFRQLYFPYHILKASQKIWKIWLLSAFWDFCNWRQPGKPRWLYFHDTGSQTKSQ